MAVDELGALNEVHTPNVGSAVLNAFVKELKAAFPEGAIEGGFGAHVLLVLRQAEAEDVVANLQELNRRLASVGIGRVKQKLVQLTFSVGIADVSQNRADALKAADRALRVARLAGGSRVVRDSDLRRSRGTVLIAEDDEISSILISHVLMKEGFEVEAIADGREVVARAAESFPNLIVLDVILPHLGGFEIAKKIRDMPHLRRTPIVFVTSMDSEADVVRGFGLGASDYIAKPFSPEELRVRLARWVPDFSEPEPENAPVPEPDTAGQPQ